MRQQLVQEGHEPFINIVPIVLSSLSEPFAVEIQQIKRVRHILGHESCSDTVVMVYAKSSVDADLDRWVEQGDQSWITAENAVVFLLST